MNSREKLPSPLPANRVEQIPQADGSVLWEMRPQEQAYALLSGRGSREKNVYGKKIDLLDVTDLKLPSERSLHINGNPKVGDTPNRNKQHGFFFTADNCIGCHACEAACSEKNENPAHLAFRSVGYVEGGCFPDYKRMNISMACNHCDNPVCLKGCPTRAYTKHAEYGAVLQDPETCFGCGYCTWVCPYNAPQLDPVKGQVSKCNMCVDRLEEGLKPACVSACLGNALDFGVIEDIPENRVQATTSIPGFPSPEITRPNIRFQQTRTLPDEMARTDSMPVKYRKSETGRYQVHADQTAGRRALQGQPVNKHWNLKRLSSRENPLVVFTLALQASVGAFILPFVGTQIGAVGLQQLKHSPVYLGLAAISFLLAAFGMLMSTLHLGKPRRFYRGFNNWRYSPVSREGLGITAFMVSLALHILFTLPANDGFQAIYSTLLGSHLADLISPAQAEFPALVFGVMATAGGVCGIYYMNRCYRIEARPFWNHWQVAASFSGSAISLGALLSGVVEITALSYLGQDYRMPLFITGCAIVLGLLLEGTGLYVHARAMRSAEHEGAASHYVQRTTFGKTYTLRNILILFNLTAAVALLLSASSGPWVLAAWCLVGLTLIVTSVLGRALFYVVVIPTTMPGAFFWRNKNFEQHAREIGLADKPQVGIAPQSH